MKKEFSFVIGEGKDRLSCLNDFDRQKSRIMDGDDNGVFIGEPQIIKPYKDGEKWYSYQQYTYETDGNNILLGQKIILGEDYIEGVGKNFFLCCCDLNNRIRVTRQFVRNLKLLAIPEFIVPTENNNMWKVIQRYTCEPQK